MVENEGGFGLKGAVGEGKCFEISRMPTSSSSEKSELSLRSLGVGMRWDEARLGLVLLQLDREEVAVVAEVRLDLRTGHCTALGEYGLSGLRGEARGFGGSGTLGGGPSGFDIIAEGTEEGPEVESFPFTDGSADAKRRWLGC